MWTCIILVLIILYCSYIVCRKVKAVRKGNYCSGCCSECRMSCSGKNEKDI